jgi:hypothetical protein
LGPQQFNEIFFDLSRRYTARVQRENLVVEPGEPTLVLRNQLRLERRFAIARHVDRQWSVRRPSGPFWTPFHCGD